MGVWAEAKQPKELRVGVGGSNELVARNLVHYVKKCTCRACGPTATHPRGPWVICVRVSAAGRGGKNQQRKVLFS